MEKPTEKHAFCISVKGQERRKKTSKESKLEIKKESEIWPPKGAKIVKKSIQKSIRFLIAFGIAFGLQNRSKNHPKSDETSIQNRAQERS